MENGTLLVDIALAIRMLIPMCESPGINSQVGNCMLLASHLRLLKHLFDELCQSKFPLSENTFNAFDLLLLALQRAKELVNKCAKGSKIYSVLRNPQTLAEFQALNTELEHILSASCLVLPRVSKQSQYLAERCIQELKRASYSKDTLEEQIRNEIETLLVEHRGGRKASDEKLQTLAGYLGISTKEEISSELAALEKVRDEARASKDKSEEDFVDQIISLFMQLSDDDFDTGAKAAGGGGGDHQSQEIPTDFKCPLSLELMYDPVIVASGQTYERAYIQHWLDQGNTRCPKTGQPLAHTGLIPNYTVKALIVNWCQTYGVPLPRVDAVKSSNWSPPVFPDSEADAARDDQLEVAESQSFSGDLTRGDGKRSDEDLSRDEIRSSDAVSTASAGPAGPAIRIITRRSSSAYSGDLSGEMEALGLSPSRSSPDHFPIFTRQRDHQGKQQERRGAFKSSVGDQVIGKDPGAEASIERLVREIQSPDPGAQREAAGELRLLAKLSSEDRIRIAQAGGIGHLVALLSSGDQKAQENAVTALLNLSLNNSNKAEIAEAGAILPLIEVVRSGTSEAKENAAATLYSLSVMKEEYKKIIGASGAIPPLVELLRTGSPRGKKDAATALYNLSLFHENKAEIVAAGAVRPLIELICEPKMGMVDRAVFVLATLSTIPQGRQAIGEDGGIAPLIEVVEAGSAMAKENAAAALFQLCSSNPRFRSAMMVEGAAPPLYVLSQMGSPRAREKAAGILRLLREQRQASMSRHPGSRHMM